jgi:translocation and assembly module TamA
VARFVALWALCLGLSHGPTLVAQSAADERIRQDAPCPEILIRGHDPDLGLSDSERKLVCGDPKSPSWKRIPLAQARYTLKSFLQARGYLHPSFSEDAAGRLIVDLGPPTLVTEVRAVGAPEGLRIDRKRKVVGQRLTPTLLSDLEGWATRRLQALGYACPKVESHADTESGRLTLEITTGELVDLRDVVTTGLTDATDPVVFRRFDAFQIGERFNGDLLSVTEDRISTNGLVESSHFVTKCDASGAHATQELAPGPPRVLIAGIGLDTEGLILGKLTWKSTRLGNRASQLSLTFNGSAIEQNLEADLAAYILPGRIRPFWKSSFGILHDDEEFYRYASTGAKTGLATTWDGSALGLGLSLGPSLTYYRTIAGSGPLNSRFLAIEAQVTATSHDFEFFKSNPESGFRVTTLDVINIPGPLTDDAAQRLSVTGSALWNFGKLDPPLFIAGVRGGFGCVVSSARPGPATALPPAFRQYLGGSSDLRGYGRQELPGPDGGMTSFFLGTELRLANELPLHLDPFLFVDLGMIGTSPFDFQSPLYRSPGAGIRWGSPVGSIRTTIAHGFPEDASGHWQFYFALGEEF